MMPGDITVHIDIPAGAAQRIVDELRRLSKTALMQAATVEDRALIAGIAAGVVAGLTPAQEWAPLYWRQAVALGVPEAEALDYGGAIIAAAGRSPVPNHVFYESAWRQALAFLSSSGRLPPLSDLEYVSLFIEECEG